LPSGERGRGGDPCTFDFGPAAASPVRTAVQLGVFEMKNFALKVRRFLASEDGPTAVEYAVMLALIIIVCLTAISSIGTEANTTFSTVADSIKNGGGS